MSESDVDDEHFDNQKMDEKLRQKLEGLIPEVLRRTFYAGLGAVFTTEEGIRKLAHEFSLPGEVANFMVKQAQVTKDELLRIVAAELRTFLEGLNLHEELQRLLTSLSFEIKTEIRFIPNDQKLVKPQVTNKVAVKRKTEPDEEEAEEEPEEAEEVGEDEEGEEP